MKIVSAGFRNQLDLAAAAATIGRAGIGGNGSEFLNGVNGRITHRSERLARSLVISVNSINGYVALVSPAASNGPCAVPPYGTQVISDNAGLKAQERGR